MAGTTPLDKAKDLETQDALVADLAPPKHKFRVSERVLAWQQNTMHPAKVLKVIPSEEHTGSRAEISYEYHVRFDKTNNKARLNTTVKEENLLEMNEEHMLLKEGLDGAVEPPAKRRASTGGGRSSAAAPTAAADGEPEQNVSLKQASKRVHGRTSSDGGRAAAARPSRSASGRSASAMRKSYAEKDENEDFEEEDEEEDDTEKVEAAGGAVGAGTDGTVEDAAPDVPTATTAFALPHSLRVLLEQDMINISQKRQLHTLPKSPSVHQILLKFKEAHVNAEDGRTHAGMLHPVYGRTCLC